jgi:ribosomal protein L25 (general stress protein Ctc)
MAITLTAEPRTELGKEKCAKLRRAGRLPANVYGGPFGTSPRTLTLDLHSTELTIKRNGKSADYELTFEGSTYPIKIQEVRYEPVYKKFEHLDLLVRSAAEARRDHEEAERHKAEQAALEAAQAEKDALKREKQAEAELHGGAEAPAAPAEAQTAAGAGEAGDKNAG